VSNGPEPGWKRRAYSIAALRQMARSTLPRPVFDFADGGAEDERTLQRNETAFDRYDLLPRPLNGAADRDLSVTLFGRPMTMPVIIGPTGLAGLFWPEGEQAAARAAAAIGVPYCLSHGSVCPLETLAETGASPRWMQIFIYRDRTFTRELTARAQAAGYDALVLTIDNQFLGNRERDIRNGFTIPPRFTLKQAFGMATRLPWLFRMRNELGRVTFGNYVRPGEVNNIRALAGRMSSLLDPAMSWQDVEALRAQWKGPMLLKGVLHPEEARRALSSGIDGLIVSNHGGRQLDGAPASLQALPSVVEAVAGSVPILIDGGIRRGADVVKAIALGASAVLVGRPQLWGLSVAGEAGVSHMLELFRREIDRTLGLLGKSRLSDLSRDDLLERR
jgi:L-lactate dehydrogenase (cytochrome)